ncbi:unnamed protein product [Brassica napus]|uniref:(rape) hypothetical protein n=1 Tax=Brassica napus TaxID=3708 RepID=A0A816JPU7_BRANA|nr:unnamed protein product [Brassica napus]
MISFMLIIQASVFSHEFRLHWFVPTANASTSLTDCVSNKRFQAGDTSCISIHLNPNKVFTSIFKKIFVSFVCSFFGSLQLKGLSTKKIHLCKIKLMEREIQ